MRVSRRRLVAALGAGLTVGLAGCGGGGDGGDGEPTLDVEPNYRGWFDGVSNYDGTVDARGQDEVEVDVGVQGNIDYYKFGPPAVAVSPGTTVSWHWTGRGGAHNVVAEQGAFESGDPVRSDGITFPYTFEAPAVYRYYCTPHRRQGMRGAVFVTLPD